MIHNEILSSCCSYHHHKFTRANTRHSTSIVCILARLFVDQPSISLSPLSEKLIEIANRAVRQHNDHQLHRAFTNTHAMIALCPIPGEPLSCSCGTVRSFCKMDVYFFQRRRRISRFLTSLQQFCKVSDGPTSTIIARLGQ